MTRGGAKFRGLLAWRWLALGMLLSSSISATDLSKTLKLAQERYGPQAVRSVVAWRLMMDESRQLPDTVLLEKVNTFFNRRMVFDSDASVWQREDYWATPLEFMGKGAGDCEDFAIAKYVTLHLLGIKSDQLRLIYVRASTGPTSIAHMVLGYYPDTSGEPLILDNLIGSIRPASSRSDLSPVFSFNDAGLWLGSASKSSADPTARLSRWRDVLERMKAEGLAP